VGAAALDRTLQALADPTRRGVVELLRGQPRRAGELAAALRTSPPALSRHLRLLRQTGLVEEEPLGRGTRVTVEHRGFASLRPGHPVRHGEEARAFVERLGRWWGDLLTSLRQASEGS
jgi:DNA-binding transcriptional ArsR family regulator